MTCSFWFGIRVFKSMIIVSKFIQNMKMFTSVPILTALGDQIFLRRIITDTRVVPKVPLHSLFCHDNNTSELTTFMITKHFIEGLWGQIFVLLRAFVKKQWRFEPLFHCFSGAGLMFCFFFLIFWRLDKYTTNKKIYFKIRFIFS